MAKRSGNNKKIRSEYVLKAKNSPAHRGEWKEHKKSRTLNHRYPPAIKGSA